VGKGGGKLRLRRGKGAFGGKQSYTLEHDGLVKYVSAEHSGGKVESDIEEERNGKQCSDVVASG